MTTVKGGATLIARPSQNSRGRSRTRFCMPWPPRHSGCDNHVCEGHCSPRCLTEGQKSSSGAHINVADLSGGKTRPWLRWEKIAEAQREMPDDHLGEEPRVPGLTTPWSSSLF